MMLMTSSLRHRSAHPSDLSSELDFQQTLKHEPYSKLQLPRRSTLGESRDSHHIGSDRGRVGVDRECRWRVPVLDVENVERLEAKLQVPFLPHRETLEHREIHVDHVRTSKHVAPQVSEGSRRNAKSARIEPTYRRVHRIRSTPTLRDSLLAVRIGVR